MNIYKNAIDSIQVGVEDYQQKDHKRGASAVRNITAGILLLYKEKLCRLSPSDNKELLIKQNIKEKKVAGETVLIGTGNTVNIRTIKKRFSEHKVDVDWNKFDNIIELRNDIEHYFTEESHKTVREIIASSFILIRDFIANELQEDPVDALGKSIWDILLEITDIFTVEKKVCTNSFKNIDWRYDTISLNIEYLQCDECGSSLVMFNNIYDDNNIEYPDIPLHCRKCNYDFNFIDVIEALVDRVVGVSSYEAVKDGGEPLSETCPLCGMETYVVEEGCCVACSYELEFTKCAVCFNPLSIHEQSNNGLCDYHQNRYEKVMRE